jgi:hypothetical protein
MIEEGVSVEVSDFRFVDLDSVMSKVDFEIDLRIFNRLEIPISNLKIKTQFYDLPGEYITTSAELEYNGKLNPLANSPTETFPCQFVTPLPGNEDFIVNIERLKALTVGETYENLKFVLIDLDLDDGVSLDDYWLDPNR